jgi:putative heme-binding domain-containing protein
MRDHSVIQQAVAKKWTEEEAGYIAGVMVDVPSPEAAGYLSTYLETHMLAKEKIPLGYQHIIRFIPAERLVGVIKKAMEKNEDDVALRSLIFKGIQEGLVQRGGKGNPQLFQQWGAKIAQGLLDKYPAEDTSKVEEKVSLQKFGVQLVGDYKVQAMEPVLKSFLQGNYIPIEVKASALRSLLKLAPERSSMLARDILQDPAVNSEFRNKAVDVLGEFPGSTTNKALEGLENLSPDLQTRIALALAGSSEGKTIVFRQVRKGILSARTLMDAKVEERLLLNASAAQQKELSSLTANLEPVDKERQALIDVRLAEFKRYKPSSLQLDSGQEVFNRNCVVCHRRVNSTGIGIGPQLHGIGKRGAAGLAEKILDPNRNISEAFRSFTIKLKNGKVMTGLYRRDEGAAVVFADLAGNEFSVAKKDIVEQKASRFTIMPDTFGATLSQEEFNALLAYLLNS